MSSYMREAKQKDKEIEMRVISVTQSGKTITSVELAQAEALREEGKKLILQGKNSEALEKYEQSLNIQPDHVDALFYSGVVLGKMGRNEEALKKYEAALKIKPNLPQALDNRRLLLEKMGKMRAISVTQSGKTITSAELAQAEVIRALREEGKKLMLRGKNSEALEALRRLNIKSNPPKILNSRLLLEEIEKMQSESKKMKA